MQTPSEIEPTKTDAKKIKKTLSVKQIGAAAAKAKRDQKDNRLADVNGLVVRIYKSGNAAFFARYEIEDGGKRKDCNLPLGVFPALSLADARRLALDITDMRRRGLDPLAERERGQREAKAKAEAEKAKPTIETLFATYDALHLSILRSVKERRRIFKTSILPAIGTLRAEDVHRTHLVEVLNAKKAQGKRTAANRILSAATHFMNWLMREGHIDTSPLALLKADPEKPRDRVLSLDELRVFWLFLASDRCNLDPRTIGAFRLLILTGARLSEVLEMKWSDINFVLGRWTIPDTKNGTSHTLPLSTLARTHIQALRPVTGSQSFVFGGKAPMCKTAPSKALRRLCERQELTLAPFTPHDLRRTVATRLAEDLQTPPHIIEAILNHTRERIEATYNKASYIQPMTKTLQQWSDQVGKFTPSVISLLESSAA
ncbi:MAG: tyrosine-type recombinase/integrase [Methylotetracoccus sp.]